jgi:hypothetical protein
MKAISSRLGEWWDTVSHHPFWSALIALLVAAVIVALAESLYDAGHAADGQTNPLRVAFQAVAPPDFEIVFPRDIGMPASSEQWAALHARGGVDMGIAAFDMTLGNRSRAPLTITGIEAQVLTSEPMPNAWKGAVFTQGDQPIDTFLANLESASPGGTAPLHWAEGGVDSLDGPLFFKAHDISLQPGEVYQAVVTVFLKPSVARELHYRFDISGNTASGGFSVHTPGAFRITAFAGTYAHSYWSLGERCWVQVTPGFPACPSA